MRFRFMLLISCSFICASTCGCATLVRGSRQQVEVHSIPSGATVTVDGELVGETPLTLDLARGDRHKARIEKAGYEPYTVYFQRTVSFSVILVNAIFLPLIGIVIDATTGAAFELAPDSIVAELELLE